MVHLAGVLEDFVAKIPNCDKREQFVVYIVRLRLSLEVGEEELLKVIDLDDALLVVDQLVQLLLQVVENPVVHHVAIDLFEHFLLAVLFFHNGTEVVVDELAAHGHRSLLAANVLEAFFAFEPLGQFQTLRVRRLLQLAVLGCAIVADGLFVLLCRQVRDDVVVIHAILVLRDRAVGLDPVDFVVKAGSVFIGLGVQTLLLLKQVLQVLLAIVVEESQLLPVPVECRETFTLV